MKGTIAEEEQVKYLISITVKEWVKIFKETGKLCPKPMRGKQPTKIDLSQLRKQVEENPSWFQDEHAKVFGVKQPAISKALAKIGITRKKKPAL